MEWEYVSGAVCGEHRPPACNCAQWTLQLTGQLLVPTTGNWTFFIPPSFDYTDDGTRLFIDGQPVLAVRGVPWEPNQAAAPCALH